MQIEESPQYQSQRSIHYQFSLKGLNSSSPKFEADFSPLRCKKTKKIVRIIPTYNQDSDVPFMTEADGKRLKRVQSMNNLANKQNKESQQMYIPKPISNYCQVCRERFTDYLRHIDHPIHKKKVQEVGSVYSIDSLKKSLDSSKCYELDLLPPLDLKNASSISIMSCSSASAASFDNFKNIATACRDQNQTDRVSIQSGEREESPSDIPMVVKRREKKKYSHFRVLRDQAKEQEVVIQEQ